MTTTWITGANGFIGRHLARELARGGATVHGLGHGIWTGFELERHGVSNWANGDITASNLSTLKARSGLPELIYHLAGGSSVGLSLLNPLEDFTRTVSSSADLLDWIRLNCPSAKLIVISSAAVYGSRGEPTIAEDVDSTPYSPYGVHKRLMEQLCGSYAINYGLQIAVARLFSVYGPGLRKQLLWDLCCRLHRREDPMVLGGTGDELRDWTDVRDVVAVLRELHTLPSPALPIVNIGTGIGTSVRQVAEQLTACWDAAHAFRPSLQFSGAARAGDPFRLVADITRLSSLGHRLNTSLDQGLEDYVRWYGNNEFIKT